MFARLLVATFALGLSTTAYGQSDTARGRLSRSRVPSPASDSAQHGNADTMEVVPIGADFSGMDAATRRRMIDTLDAQRRIWDERRPQAYVIRVLEMSTCVDVHLGARALLRDQLVVRDTIVVRRQPVPIPATYKQHCALPWRVDDLFADLARALADPNVDVRVSYDAAYGFPRKYWVIRTGSADTGRAALVESFAPAP